MLVARFGATASAGAILALLVEMVRQPHRLIAAITPWLHANHMHLLPSTFWLEVAIWLAGILAICAFFCRSEPRAPHAVSTIESASTALLAELLHTISRAPKSGASLSLALPEGSLTMNAQLFLLNAEVAVLKVGLNAAENDQAKFISVMQALVTKGGDLATKLADSIVEKQFASNALLNAVFTEFEPEVESAIAGEVQSLEAQAGTEEQKLLALGSAWIQNEIASREALIAADSPAAAPAAASLEKPPELLAAVEYQPVAEEAPALAALPPNAV